MCVHFLIVESIAARSLHPESSSDTRLACVVAVASSTVNASLPFNCAGPASIQMCDIVRMPIVEVEVQDIAFALTKQSSIAQCYASLQACVHSYNAMLRSWEPILQKSHFIVHLDQNSSSLVGEVHLVSTQLC